MNVLHGVGSLLYVISLFAEHLMF